MGETLSTVIRARRQNSPNRKKKNYIKTSRISCDKKINQKACKKAQTNGNFFHKNNKIFNKNLSKSIKQYLHTNIIPFIFIYVINLHSKSSTANSQHFKSFDFRQKRQQIQIIRHNDNRDTFHLIILDSDYTMDFCTKYINITRFCTL